MTDVLNKILDLKQGIVDVEFMKKDGTVTTRKMTLNSSGTITPQKLTLT
jgi:hypothetical protein